MTSPSTDLPNHASTANQAATASWYRNPRPACDPARDTNFAPYQSIPISPIGRSDFLHAEISYLASGVNEGLLCTFILIVSFWPISTGFVSAKAGRYRLCTCNSFLAWLGENDPQRASGVSQNSHLTPRRKESMALGDIRPHC